MKQLPCVHLFKSYMKMMHVSNFSLSAIILINILILPVNKTNICMNTRNI